MRLVSGPVVASLIRASLRMKANNLDPTRTATSDKLASESAIQATKESVSAPLTPSTHQSDNHMPEPLHVPLVLSNAMDPRKLGDARSLNDESSLTLFEMDRYHWGQRSASRLSSPSFIHQTTGSFQSVLCSPSAAMASNPSLPLSLPATTPADADAAELFSVRLYDPTTLDFHKELDRFIGELSFDALSAWIPPFTRYTLRELEMASVLDNPQVRHDLSLRPDLCFKPDESDAELIRMRQKDLRDYWEKVVAELGWLESWRHWKSHQTSGSTSSLSPPSLLYPQLWPFRAPLILLPLLVNEIKEVILDILSTSKKDVRAEVMHRFDLTSLLRHAQAGHPLSMEPWNHIFHALLEPVAESHRKKLFEPLRNPTSSPVELFKAFLDILEAMKLDLINKELNANKPYIIETAPRYEWSVFCTQLKSKEISIFYLENWYHDMYKRHALGEAMMPDDYKCLYYQGVLDLISMNEYWSCHAFFQLPETFRLDVLNLKKAFDYWKELTIIQSSLLIYRQMSSQGTANPSLTLLQVKALYEEMLVLLGDPEISSAHLRAHLSRAISKARGTACLAEADERLVQSLWNDYLTPGHRVHQLMVKRLRSLFLSYLQTGQLDTSLLASSGWQTCAPTLKACLSALKPVIDLNLATYRSLYNLLFKKFDAKFHAAYSNKLE